MTVRSESLASVTLRDIAIIVFRRWRPLAAVFAGAVIAALGYLLLIQEPVYESEARLLIRLGQESAPPPTMMLDRQVLVTRTPSDVNSELDILRSRELLSAVVTRLNLPDLMAAPPPQGLLRRVKYEIKAAISSLRATLDEALIAIGLQERLSLAERLVNVLGGAVVVTVQPNSNVLVVTLLWPWREGASVVLEAYLAAYQELRQRAAAGASSVRFFEELRAESRGRLQSADSELGRFESASGIQMLEEQKISLVRQLADAEARLAQALAERQLAELRLSWLDDAHRDGMVGFGTFETGSVGQMMALDLAKLRAEHAALAAREDSGSTGRIRLQREIGSMVASLTGHLRSALGEKQDNYRLAAVRRDSLATELARLHGTEIRWCVLRREAKSAEESYQFHDRKLEEARAVAALDAARIANVTMLQPPTPPTGAAQQRRGLILALAAAMGLLAGIAWIGLLEFLDHRIHTVDDLARRLDVPVLGVVPRSRLVARFR